MSPNSAKRLLSLSLPLSQHLSKLRAWNFVNARREGQQVYYTLASGEVRQVLTTLYGIDARDLIGWQIGRAHV